MSQIEEALVQQPEPQFRAARRWWLTIPGIFGIFEALLLISLLIASVKGWLPGLYVAEGTLALGTLTFAFCFW